MEQVVTMLQLICLIAVREYTTGGAAWILDCTALKTGITVLLPAISSTWQVQSRKRI